jgi:hypothetical protein
MATATEIFEAIAGCYYRRFHRLAPGKSEPIETGRNSNDDENREEYDLWRKREAILDAAARIVELESVLEKIVREYDDTYDAETDTTGIWTSAASIPVEVMERAQRLLR